MAGTPEPISGARTTDTLASGEKPVDMWPVAIQLEDNKDRLMTFVGSIKGGRRKVDNVRFDWRTDELVPITDTLSASATATATSLSVDGDGSDECYFIVGDILMEPSSEETVLVTAVSARTLTVTRSWGATAGADFASGATLVKIGSAAEEMGKLRDSNDAYISVTTQTAENYNYIQDFRDPVVLSERALKTGHYGYPDPMNGQRHKKLLEHCRKINQSFWFSERALSGSRSTMNGLYRVVPAGNSEAITTLTEDELEDFIRVNTRYGAKSGRGKVLFASRKVHQIISRLAGPNQRITNTGKSTEYGVEVNEYLAGSGDRIGIKNEIAFEDASQDDIAVLVDPAGLAVRHLEGQFMRLDVNVQLPDQKGRGDCYNSDCGLQTGNASHHAKITGVVS